MAIEIKFGKSVVEVVCDDEEKIRSLAGKINKSMDELRQSNQKISDAKLAFLTALMLQDEIEQVRSQLATAQNVKEGMVSRETFIKTLNSISEYIENVATKLEKG